MRRLIRITAISMLVIAILHGCAPMGAGKKGGDASDATAMRSEPAAASNGSSTPGNSYTGGWGLLTDGFFDEFAQRLERIESEAIDELEDRRTAQPRHYSIGEETQITGNLAVRIDAVEGGPYDYADRTPTVKVTATMRNLSDHTIWVKPSNFDVDASDGRRLNHKIYIKDDKGRRDVRSFYPTKISPGASYTGDVYFDGEGVKSVIYIPHFVISSENQYVYFDLE